MDYISTIHFIQKGLRNLSQSFKCLIPFPQLSFCWKKKGYVKNKLREIFPTLTKLTRKDKKRVDKFVLNLKKSLRDADPKGIFGSTEMARAIKKNDIWKAYISYLKFLKWLRPKLKQPEKYDLRELEYEIYDHLP